MKSILALLSLVLRAVSPMERERLAYQAHLSQKGDRAEINRRGWDGQKRAMDAMAY